MWYAAAVAVGLAVRVASEVLWAVSVWPAVSALAMVCAVTHAVRRGPAVVWAVGRAVAGQAGRAVVRRVQDAVTSWQRMQDRISAILDDDVQSRKIETAPDVEMTSVKTRGPISALGESRDTPTRLRSRGSANVESLAVRRPSANVLPRTAVPSKSRDTRTSPRDPYLGPSNTRVTPRLSPRNARLATRPSTSPRDTRTSPRDTRTSPRDTRTSPRDTRTSPRDALTSPRDSRVLTHAPSRTNAHISTSSRQRVDQVRSKRSALKTTGSVPKITKGDSRDIVESRVDKEARKVEHTSESSGNATSTPLGTVDNSYLAKLRDVGKALGASPSYVNVARLD